MKAEDFESGILTALALAKEADCERAAKSPVYASDILGRQRNRTEYFIALLAAALKHTTKS